MAEMYNRHRDALWLEIADDEVIDQRRATAAAAWENCLMVPLEGAEPEYDGPHRRMLAHYRVAATGRWYVADRLLTTPEMLRVTAELVLAGITTTGAHVPSLPKPVVQAEPVRSPTTSQTPGRGRRIALRLLGGLGVTGGVAVSRAFPGPGPVIVAVCLGLLLWGAVALYRWAATPTPKPEPRHVRPY